MRSRAVEFQPHTTMWSLNPDAPKPWPSLSRKSMTIATRAPVIMPSMATPNRMSNQPTIRPAGRRHERRVALAQDRGDPPVERVEDGLERPRLLEQRDEDARRRGRTRRCPPRASGRSAGRAEPPTRRTCHATRRISGLASTGIGRRAIAPDRATRTEAPRGRCAPARDRDVPPRIVGGPQWPRVEYALEGGCYCRSGPLRSAMPRVAAAAFLVLGLLPVGLGVGVPAANAAGRRRPPTRWSPRSAGSTSR